MTNIYIYLDTTWPYNLVVDYINFVVQRLNINPYASSVMLLAAADGTAIVNKTNYITDFYMNWNRTVHAQTRQGFSLPHILSSIRDQAELLQAARDDANLLGGQSIVALMVPSAVAVVREQDYRYCNRFLEGLKWTHPDIHYLYYAGGAVVRFKDFVVHPREDLFPLGFDMSVRQAAEPVVKRIRNVPRRLVNPRCDAYWSILSYGFNEMPQYVPLGSINFYRMLPNYFWGWGSMRYLKVKPTTAISFTVCTSRSLEHPFRNATAPFTDGQECSQITTADFSYDLTDSCIGYDTVQDCPPLYLSVQAQGFADASQNTCKAAACQTPNEAQYRIFVNNLGCNNNGRSSSGRTVACLHAIFILFILSYLC